MGLHYTPPSLRKLQSRDLPTHGHFPAPLHDYHNHPELVILHPTPITTAFITKISLPTVPCADSLFAGTGYLTSPTADQSEFYPSNTFFMSHTNDFHNDNSHNHNDEDSSNTHYNSTLSKKRSPEFAFLTSSGDTPPSSRPPSRSHTQKRPRHKRLTERPRYVTEKDASIQLQHSATSVDVMWPGGTEMERGLLGDFLFGGRNGPRGENQGRRRGFSVLCFLGCTIEHLQTLSQVASLLENLNASIFGVSLTPPPPNSSSLPIIHDFTRSLTLHLGLMHPLGGGRQSLDAIVVLDNESRRRMLLPVGWGPTATPTPGIPNSRNNNLCVREENGVQAVVRNVVQGVEWLAGERDEEMEMEMEIDVVMGGAGWVETAV